MAIVARAGIAQVNDYRAFTIGHDEHIQSNKLSAPGTIDIRESCPCEGAPHVKVYVEKIDPPTPLSPLSSEEQLTLKLEELASDDRWVKNLIDGLAGAIRDL